MTITPLFTAAELDQQIAAYKKAMLKLATAREATIAGDTIRREDLPNIRRHLEWLQGERVKLVTGSGPQIATGRPRR